MSAPSLARSARRGLLHRSIALGNSERVSHFIIYVPEDSRGARPSVPPSKFQGIGGRLATQTVCNMVRARALCEPRVLRDALYSYDAAVGGSPTSYSPPVAVAEPLALQLIGGLQRLQLRFRNGRRNLHVQGGNFPDGAPVDLQLRLGFGGGGAAAAVVELGAPHRRRRRRYRLHLKAEGLGGTRRWASPSCWRRSRS